MQPRNMKLIARIYDLRSQGLGPKKIAKLLDIGRTTVYRILRGVAPELCACGRPPVDRFRGVNLCAACLNKDVPTSLDDTVDILSSGLNCYREPV
jgi:hypothetical protein